MKSATKRRNGKKSGGDGSGMPDFDNSGQPPGQITFEGLTDSEDEEPPR